MVGYSKRKGFRLRRSIVLYACVIAAGYNGAAIAQTDSFAACRALTDKVARYACYDSLEKALPPQALAARPAPDSQNSAPPTQPNNAAAAPQMPELIISAVQSLVFDREGKFTVTLANGQVWHQFDADSGNARFRKDIQNTVKITHIFWKTYDLQINNQNAVYRVERLR
jgi:hypothetical protein